MNTAIIQSMINAIDKPAIFITPDYVIRAVNESYRDTYPSSIVVGNSRCHEISHNNDRPCNQYGEDCPLKACKLTRKTANVVHIHQTDDGRRYCDILMKPVLDENGEIAGYLEILDNLSFASVEPEDNKMVGASPAFRQLLNSINRAAQSDISVLLQGQTGTGKELVAQALHDSSRRSEKPFVVIECTGLNDNLFESELFGHEKGAFTGATTSKKGLIEVANGGTVFFDEIGDVPLNMQVKLLRLLETRSFRPVGGLKQKKADFRLVCASHKNLLEMVSRGEFRVDLYYRIAGFPIHLPSLEERKSDIPLLAKHFLQHSEYHHKRFTEGALSKMCDYAFPGNIRELRNIVEMAALLANDDDIEASDLPSHVQFGEGALCADVRADKVMSLDDLEANYLNRLCATFSGTPDELAQDLGVSTRTLYRKLQRFGIKFGTNS